MIDIKENKESFKQHLIGFHSMVEYYQKQNPNKCIDIIADDYIDNELAMAEGMREYVECLNKIYQYNQRILRAIKTVKGKTFYKYLVEFIKDGEPTDYCEWELITSPVGKEQDVSDYYGREIKKEWVVQRSVGDSGDSWEGTICVKIRENKYLKFNFSM